MGIPAIRPGLMTALLALLLSLFVLVSAVDAATCGPEAATPSVTTVADIPGDESDGGGPDSHAICAHGHCHHSGVAVPAASESPVMTQVGADLNALPLADGLPSRIPAGPDRPPRG